MLGNPDSGIQDIFACRIQNPGLWNLGSSSMNPESHQGLKSGIQVVESSLQVGLISLPINSKWLSHMLCLPVDVASIYQKDFTHFILVHFIVWIIKGESLNKRLNKQSAFNDGMVCKNDKGQEDARIWYRVWKWHRTGKCSLKDKKWLPDTLPSSLSIMSPYAALTGRPAASFTDENPLR